MRRRHSIDPIDPVEISNAKTRSLVFREMARDVSTSIRRGETSEGPSDIAKLMEKAYRAGFDAAREEALSKRKDGRTSQGAKMTDLDLPPRTRQQLYLFRLAIGAATDRTPEREIKPEGMAMFMRPKVFAFPDTVSKDEWLFLVNEDQHSLGKLTVSPLIGTGLFVERELEDGWRLAVLSEWGFELLVTGGTTKSEGRMKGSSSTYDRFMSLMEEKPVMKAGRALGLIGEEAPAPRVP